MLSLDWHSNTYACKTCEEEVTAPLFQLNIHLIPQTIYNLRNFFILLFPTTSHWNKMVTQCQEFIEQQIKAVCRIESRLLSLTPIFPLSLKMPLLTKGLQLYPKLRNKPDPTKKNERRMLEARGRKRRNGIKKPEAINFRLFAIAPCYFRSSSAKA